MNIQVIGAGSWGIALARLLAHNGHRVALWCRSESGAETLRTLRQRPELLPGVLLPPGVSVSTHIMPDAEMAVLVTPSHALRAILQSHPLPPNALRVCATKGLENDTLLRMSEVIQDVDGPRPVVALSGPSHAEEVGRDLPASLVAASPDPHAAVQVQQTFMNQTFRVYTSTDLLGVELGGALKNVMAIAAGACDGLGLGDNAKAAMITRGLAEIARRGLSLGANPLTFAGLSGLGDLVVTCASRHSRNRAVGERLAKGETLDQIQQLSHTVAEGVRTARAARQLAQRQAVEMPITEHVCRVLFENEDPRQAINALMARGPKPEHLHPAKP